ncbi:MAG: cryptochrome/photolyase family protein [Nocardioidaceae bacterium]
MSASERTRAVLWFRRDLRLADNPALLEALDSADEVVPLFVLDPRLWRPAGRPRQAYLRASFESLRDRIGGLVIRRGDPVEVVPTVARQAAARSVHVAADFGPYGSMRDAAVERVLADDDVPLVRTGSPYAVAPGRVVNKSGDGYLVYTPFSKAWREHGWRQPPRAPGLAHWHTGLRSDDLYEVSLPEGIVLPAAGEEAALRQWRAFVADKLTAYPDRRDRPDLDATSHMSVHLKWGEIHPRTMLADIEDADAPRAAVATFRNELAWREFYADVLAKRPETAREYYKAEFARMTYAPPNDLFDAWRQGRTGYPIVDAGMRQLRAEGWMHNRVRMIVASFLVKDLHIEWQHGARHFMQWLVDGDLASNQHGWQWTAGCGTDAAPYFRVFNPVEQGKKFDPDGDYIRRYVPELRDVRTPDIHQPRNPIVDHAEERRVALARYDEVRNA